MSVNVIVVRVAQLFVGYFGSWFIQLANSYKVEKAHQANKSMNRSQGNETFCTYGETSEAQNYKWQIK